MNTNIENVVKQCATCLDYHHTQLQENTILKRLPNKPWEIFGADIFSIDNETLLCIIDYYTKFPVMKRAERLSADDIIRTTKVLFAEFGLPKKFESDSGMRLVLHQLKQFCRQLNKDQARTSL